MATFTSGSYTTSTPFPHYDSGFCGSSPQSRSSSQSSIGEDLDFFYFPLRKNLFGKRRNDSENIPINQFSRKHKVLLSRSSFAFSRRDAYSNKETPRTTRSFAGSDKPVCQDFEEVEMLRLSYSNRKRFKKFHGNDSGFHGKTPERSESPKSEGYGIPLFQVLENVNPENSKEESLAYFKHSLDVFGTENFADLSVSNMQRLYYIYRFQRMGLKPSVTVTDFCEKHSLIKDLDEGSEMLLSSWKDRLERISAELKYPPKVDFLSQLHNINAYSVISEILSYLSGHDLQNASCVDQLWRKLVLKDEEANKARLAYLKKMYRKEIEVRKSVNPFQRPPNYRILGSVENFQKEQFQFEKTIKEINFDAFIEVGKSGENHRPMKCPSCYNLSLQDKQIITKYNCLFCGHEFCCNCLKPYSNWHFCSSTYIPTMKPPANGKRYLRRL